MKEERLFPLNSWKKKKKRKFSFYGNGDMPPMGSLQFCVATEIYIDGYI